MDSVHFYSVSHSQFWKLQNEDREIEPYALVRGAEWALRDPMDE
jgi:hypothetical protein